QEKILGGSSTVTDINLSAAGGNANTSFRLGGSFHTQGTVLPIDMDYKKLTTSLSLNHKSDNDKLNINLSVNYGVDKTKSSITYGIMPLAFELPPNAPALYNEDGTLHWEEWSYSFWDNPLKEKYNPSNNQMQNLISNAGISYDLFDDVQAKVNLGYTQNIMEGKNLRLLEGVAPENRD